MATEITLPDGPDKILTIDDYFRVFAKHHVQKSTELLQPLHVPGRDELPELGSLYREPFDAQAHVIAALSKTLDVQKSAILAAEMGTGKTLMGMASVHAHACRSRRKGGTRGKYRALILCPDHLILKWKDEIERTIPGAIVTTFDVEGKGCKQLIKDMVALYGRLRGKGGRWTKPEGAEWYILGRDQSKLMPGVSALGGERRGFDGRGMKHGSSYRTLVTAKDDDGNYYRKEVRVYQCPKCGGEIVNKDGDPISIDGADKRLACGQKYAVQLPEEGQPPIAAPHILRTISVAKMKVGTIFQEYGNGRRYQVKICGEPLWQFVAEPRRWAPATFLASKMPKLFDYLIADEVHQQKSKVTAQANAFGKLAAQSRHVLALTGTLVGGYARDVFYLMLRTDARALRYEGFGWGKDMAFTRRYGRIETTVTTRTNAKGESTVSTKRRSLAKDDEKEDERPAPGVMPALFGRHLISRTIFLSLDDMADNLPKFREYVGGPPSDDFDEEDREFWVETACDMTPEQSLAYKTVEGALADKCQELLQKGSMKLLGQLLVATLGYPDMPYGWEAPTGRKEHKACGYWDLPKLRTPGNWVGVVQPPDLPQDVVYPKEQALLDIVERETKAGNQVWVYCQMTDKRDVRMRLQKLLAERGYSVAVLKSAGSGGPKPKDRLAWIEKNGNKQVIISHPQLVETGIDFFKRRGDDYAHNFNAIVFYETGYNLFTLRQAARRAWRCGQERSCRVYYLYYRGTGQDRAMKLIARKLEAAMQIDGELSAEGLASMSDEQSAAMALARSISDNIDEATDIGRSWTKVGAKVKPGAKIARVPDRALAAVDGEPIRGIDILSMQSELIAQTLLDYDAEAPTISADQLAELYEAFGGEEDWLDDLADTLDFDPDELLNACS